MLAGVSYCQRELTSLRIVAGMKIPSPVVSSSFVIHFLCRSIDSYLVLEPQPPQGLCKMLIKVQS